MFIFAHRGLERDYPENSFFAIEKSFEDHFSVECDVRRTKNGIFVFHHDADAPISVDNNKKRMICEMRYEEMSFLHLAHFDEIGRLIRRKAGEQKVAFHVKYEEQQPENLRELSKKIHDYALYEHVFLFDLTEESARLLRRYHPSIRIGISISEECYTPTIYTWARAEKFLDLFDYVWWDEWKKGGVVYNEHMARTIRDAGKEIYAISPELHRNDGHPAAQVGYHDVWRQFIQWGIEGVCTSYPYELRTYIERIT